MIERYSVAKIEDIWSDEHKYNLWLKIEVLIAEGWSKLKVIPESDIKKIKNNSFYNKKRMLEIEEQTRHDVIAFTRMLSEQLGFESRWIHLGITSTDIVDTAQNYLIKQSNEIIQSELEKLLEILKNLALQNKNTLIMGRTHGMYGEPTSLGLKFILWYEEIKRQIKRFKLAREQIEVTKISGSMGNYANLELEIDEYVAKKLDLKIDLISTQVTQRDKHAFLISVFANIASTIEKISTEIRLLSRSEVNEITEGFFKNQKGSSSMPHKKNPISTENMTGLARYIKSFLHMTLENNNLWHERDISHSSNERIMFPDIYNVLTYTLMRMNTTLKNLVINYDVIKENINKANNIFFSQRILTYILIKNNKVSREEIYDLLQQATFSCFNENKNFKQVLLEKNILKYINKEDFENLFDINFFLRHVEKIFIRIFI